MKVKVLLAIQLGLALACATVKEWHATGGSRADGVVRLSYEYGGLEIPQTSVQQAQQLARSRCPAWGYSDAEPFGGEMKTCRERALGDCQSWMVSVDYQCTGSPDR